MTLSGYEIPRPCRRASELKQDAQLVEQLSALTGRAVRDKTGLAGRYDFAMKLDLQMVLALAQKMGANVPAAAANIRRRRARRS